MSAEKYINAGASISTCGRYRWALWREWRGTHDRKNWRWFGEKDGAGEPKSCLFVMLNPSTADGKNDDATIRRCVGFAKAWKYERLEVVNLFAYRATKPRDLLKFQNDRGDVIGLHNSTRIAQAGNSAGLIICAWGAFARELDPMGDHADTVRGWLGDPPCHALGFTKAGDPRHPLYAPSSAMPVPMVPS